MGILRLRLSFLVLLFGGDAVDGLLAKIRPVQIGGCYNTSADEILHCAAVEGDCSDAPGTRFKSAEQLGFAGEQACAADTLVVGHCGGSVAAEDGGLACATTEHACADPDGFVLANYYLEAATFPDESSQRCTAQGRNHAVTGELLPTLYGACRDGMTGAISCLFDPSDCPARSAWVPADVAGCQCRDVRVGLCESGGHGGSSVMDVKCAVSPDDCEFSTFVPPGDAEDHPSLVDCRLCPDTPELAAAALRATNGGAEARELDGQGVSTSTIVLSTIFGTLAFVAISMVAIKFAPWRRHEEKGSNPAHLADIGAAPGGLS